MGDLVVFVTQLALGIAVPWALLRWDERRLDGAQLARSWSEVSRWSALVAFGPLCLPVHCIKTRGWLVGALLGVVALIVALTMITLLTWPVDALMQWVSGAP